MKNRLRTVMLSLCLLAILSLSSCRTAYIFQDLTPGTCLAVGGPDRSEFTARIVTKESGLIYWQEVRGQKTNMVVSHSRKARIEVEKGATLIISNPTSSQAKVMVSVATKDKKVANSVIKCQ